MKNCTLKILGLVMIYSITANAQPYPSTLRIANTTLTRPNSMQFEVWFKNTHAFMVYELASFELKFNYNKAIFTDTAGKKLEYLASDLPIPAIRPRINSNPDLVFQNSFTPGRISTTPGRLPGHGFGQILNSGDSIMIGRYQISCTNPINLISPDISFRSPDNERPYCLFAIYVGEKAVVIQNDAIFINELVPLILDEPK